MKGKSTPPLSLLQQKSRSSSKEFWVYVLKGRLRESIKKQGEYYEEKVESFSDFQRKTEKEMKELMEKHQSEIESAKKDNEMLQRELKKRKYHPF